MKDAYRHIAKEYDAYFNTKRAVLRHRQLFRTLIKKYHVSSCLDCACGTGWHLAMLHGMGLRCAGSDLSAPMLAAARENLKGKAIPLKKEDYRHLSHSWKQKFDMVICVTTGFAHMLTDSDAIQALRSMQSRLNDGGILILSNGIADAMYDEQPRLIPGVIQRSRAVYFFMEYPDPKRVIFNVIRIKKTRTGFEHALDRVEYNAIRKRDFERYFASVPFRKVRYYGGHDFSPFFRKKSGRIVVVAQK